MTEAYQHTEKTVLFALDIAKRTHDALIALRVLPRFNGHK